VRHRIKHHVNRPILHMGMFTDAQMLPGACLFALAVGWLYAGGGGVVTRGVIAGVLMLPIGVMVVDNRVGGLVMNRLKAYIRWHRTAGIFEPGAESAHGYVLTLDGEDQHVLDREELARADLDTAFAHDA
jgi:hypothetical protein